MGEDTKKISSEKEQLNLFESLETRVLSSQKNCNPPDYKGSVKFQNIGPSNWSKITKSSETNLDRKFCFCKKFEDGVFCKPTPSFCESAIKKGGSK